MAKRPIDLVATRQALAKFDQALADFPELGKPNPEREEAFHRSIAKMPRKPSGRPRGRPKSDEGYVTMALRLPLPLATRVKAYARLHYPNVSKLILDALERLLNEGATTSQTAAEKPSVAPPKRRRTRAGQTPRPE